MQIEYVDPEHAQALDAFVLSHPNGHFMQSSLWGRVKTDWHWYGILCRDSGGTIRGSMALLSRSLGGFRACMLYAPRGPVFESGDVGTLHELVAAARALGRRLGAYLLRMDPRFDENDAVLRPAVRALGFRVNRAEDFSLYQPRLCYLLPLEGKTPQSLEAGYRRSTRNNLHKARRLGVTVRRGGSEDLPDFCRMMARTGRKNHFTPRSESYFRSFLRGLGKAARLYLAEKDGRPVAAAICVFLCGQCVEMYSCSDPAFWKAFPNELLQWTVQADAIAAGCRVCDFRGVEGRPVEGNPHLGLHRFKQGFGAELHAYLGQLDLPLRRPVWLFASLLYALKRRLG